MPRPLEATPDERRALRQARSDHEFIAKREASIAQRRDMLNTLARRADTALDVAELKAIVRDLIVTLTT